MFAAAFMAGLLAGQAPAGDAPGNDQPVCQAPSGVQELDFGSLPSSVQADLRRKTGDMALPGQPYNATDATVDRNLPFWRGVFAWRSGDRWLAAVERGGRGHSDMVFLYSLTSGGKAHLLEQDQAITGTLCGIAQGVIAAP